MNYKRVTMLALSAVMAAAPLTDASAHGWGGHRGHGGGRDHDFGLFALGAAVVGATAVVLSAPFNAIADAGAPEPYYPPQPYYPQQAYQQAPAPYYYAPAQAYYAPAPVHYAPAPYYGRRYYRY